MAAKTSTKSKTSPVASARKRRPLAHQPSSCTALVLSDGSKRRQKEWALYEASCQRLEAESQELRSFEEEEVAAHRLWIESHFAKELSDMRSLQIKLMEQVELIQIIEEYAERADLSLPLAYNYVMQAKANDALEELWNELEKTQSGRSDDEEDDAFEEVWKEFEDFFEQEYSNARERKRSDEEDSSHSRKKGASQKSTCDRPRVDDEALKSLYYKLMHLLHPDTHPEQSEQEKAQFHAVQRAYLAKDIEDLEKLYQAVTSSTESLFKRDEASISDIMARRKQVEKRLRELQKQMTQAKLHPAWGFLQRRQNPKSLTRYRQSIQNELIEDMVNLRYELLQVESVLLGWEKKAKRAAKSKAPKKRQSISNQAF